MKICRECGVPYAVSKELVWHENGVITQTRDPDHRMIFYESDNLDNLFMGIEEIIGVPIEHIIIESKRREVKEYVERLLPAPVRKAARYGGMGMMIRKLSNVGRAYGYGNVRMADRKIRRRNDDYVTRVIDNPHAILFYCGENLGAWEAIDGRDSRVRYEEITANTFEVTNYIGKHPIELHERLRTPTYARKQGDIFFERCPFCRVPLDVASCKWNPELGTINDPSTGRRMAIFGPAGFEAVLDDLEVELGAAIPETVIEAQRRYIVKSLSPQDLGKGKDAFRRMFALRGLGNLVNLEVSEGGISATIENSCLPLLMVGVMQGACESLFAHEKTGYEWEARQDGDLNISIYRR
ncbi:MAG: hypothetical protein C4536_10075 [Actinobacteria bacterium]|nr:MAG: hypothetical protein C4536_10075 [Actinomycetota bacterium]